jgi:DNA polymerase
MDPRRAAVLGTIGIDRFVARTPAAAPGVAPDAAPALAAATLDWDGLAAAVAGCTRCGLAATRTQTVFGVGDRRARWLVVGEAPGADEDRQGEPFVGRAGQLLNSMLRAAGLGREQVFIANVLKCRPPGNRDPLPEEVRCCLPYLHRQIALIEPRLILCVGRIAAQNLLGVDTPLGQLRGRTHELKPFGTPVVVTYHPAYLLRSPGEKRKSWSDLKLAMEVARGRSA